MLLLVLLLFGVHGLVVFERYEDPRCLTRVLPDTIPMLGINYAQLPFPSGGVSTLLVPMGRFLAVNATTIIIGDNTDFVNGTCIDHAVFRYGKFRNVPGPAIMTLARKENGPQGSDVDRFKCINHQNYYWYTFVYPVITFSNTSGCPVSDGATQYYLQKRNTSVASCSYFYGPNQMPLVPSCFDYSDPAVPACASQHRCMCTLDADCSVPAGTTNLGGFYMNNGLSISGPSVVDSVRVIESNSLPPPKGTPPPTSSGSRLVVAAVWLFWFLAI
jgi:hypothetical protein